MRTTLTLGLLEQNHGNKSGSERCSDPSVYNNKVSVKYEEKITDFHVLKIFWFCFPCGKYSGLGSTKRHSISPHLPSPLSKVK